MSVATKESPMSTATEAVRNEAAATAAALAPVTETVVAAWSQTSTVAGAIVTGTTEVLTPLVQSAADRARELSDGFAAEVKKVAALTMDAYQQAIKRQLDLSIGLADAVKVDWVSELTRRNAMVIGEPFLVSNPGSDQTRIRELDGGGVMSLTRGHPFRPPNASTFSLTIRVWYLRIRWPVCAFDPCRRRQDVETLVPAFVVAGS